RHAIDRVVREPLERGGNDGHLVPAAGHSAHRFAQPRDHRILVKPRIGRPNDTDFQLLLARGHSKLPVIHRKIVSNPNQRAALAASGTRIAASVSIAGGAPEPIAVGVGTRVAGGIPEVTVVALGTRGAAGIIGVEMSS